MTTRPPATPLRSSLRAVHARIRRALVLRHALRASAAASVLLAFAVTAGLALPRTQATAGVRLALFAAGALLSLVLAALAMRRDTPRWDGWLESLEGRFAGLRSWLRNALDLEASPGSPPPGATPPGNWPRRCAARPSSGSRPRRSPRPCRRSRPVPRSPPSRPRCCRSPPPSGMGPRRRQIGRASGRERG